MNSFIAYHEKIGIYLGVFSGYALFSANKIAFSSKAIRFDSAEAVREFFSNSISKSIADEIQAIPVQTSSTGNYIDLVDILKSGHKKHTESMLDNFPTLSDTIH